MSHIQCDLNPDLAARPDTTPDPPIDLTRIPAGRPGMADVLRECRGWEIRPYPQPVNDALAPFLAGADRTVYLHGAAGCGKTWLAAAILFHLRLRGRGVDCKWGSFLPVDLFAHWVRAWDAGRERIAWWTNCPVLVLDDIGAARTTDAVTEAMEFLLVRRYRRNLLTIATSNLDLPRLDAGGGARIASRFRDGLIVNMGQQDLRGHSE